MLEAELAKRAAPLVLVGVIGLTVCVMFGAVFKLGREAGLKAGAAAGVEAVERVSQDLTVCRSSVENLKAGLAMQNAAVAAQAQAAAKAQARAEAAAAQARTEAQAHRERAARLLSLKPEGGECSQAAALLQAYGADR